MLFPVFAQSKDSAMYSSTRSAANQPEFQRDVQAESRSVPPPLTQMSTAAMAQERQVIRKGSISVRVKSVEDAERQITQSVIDGGGYVESTTTSDLAGDDPTVDMTIRVKSSGFEDSLARLAELGTVLSKKVEATDVTAKIVDLGARVRTLTAKEDTFREMLRGARTTKDVIDLQNRLTEVRMEIERMEAQRVAEPASLAIDDQYSSDPKRDHARRCARPQLVRPDARVDRNHVRRRHAQHRGLDPLDRQPGPVLGPTGSDRRLGLEEARPYGHDYSLLSGTTARPGNGPR